MLSDVKNMVILGASGYMGQWLVKKFIEHYNLTLITSKKNQISASCIVLSSDDFFRNGIDQEIDVFINASVVYDYKESLTNSINCNILLPLRILEKLKKSQNFMFFQFDSFYSKFYKKNTNTSPYILSKKNMLEWSKLLNLTSNISVIVLRIEHLVGPNETLEKFNGKLIHKLKNNKEISLSSGTQKLDLIHIEDVISAIAILIEKNVDLKGKFKLFEVGTGKNYPLKKFVLALKKKLNSSSKLNFGAVNVEKHKLMDSEANTAPLVKMGWKYKYDFNKLIDSIV